MAAYTRPKYAVFFPSPPAITEFRKILRKRRNSTETGKFPGLDRNSAYCGKLWSLVMILPGVSTVEVTKEAGQEQLLEMGQRCRYDIRPKPKVWPSSSNQTSVLECCLPDMNFMKFRFLM